jgi:hypothetical protein
MSWKSFDSVGKDHALPNRKPYEWLNQPTRFHGMHGRLKVLFCPERQ